MLYGRTPFQDTSTWIDLFHRISTADVQIPEIPPISEAGKTFISKLLQLNPIQRPSALQALRDPWLQQACNSLGVLQSPDPETESLSDVSADSHAPGPPSSEKMAPGDDGFRTIFFESGVRVDWDDETGTLRIADPVQSVVSSLASSAVDESDDEG